MKERDTKKNIKEHKVFMTKMVRDVLKAEKDKNSILSKKSDSNSDLLKKVEPKAKIDSGLNSSMYDRLKLALDVSMGADIDVKQLTK
jgi:hypothetical protein